MGFGVRMNEAVSLWRMLLPLLMMVLLMCVMDMLGVMMVGMVMMMMSRNDNIVMMLFWNADDDVIL